MRTTLTLDRDVAALLSRLRKKYPGKLRTLINDALRTGLTQLSTREKPRDVFRTRAVSLGKCKLDNLDNIAEVLAFAEGEDFK